MVNDSGLLPTFFWFIISVFFISITFFQNKGLPYVFLGARLHLPDKAWSSFNLLTIYLFLGLAIIGYLVNQLASEEVWSFYKLFGQSLCLLLLPLLGSWSVVMRVKT
jgi:intracellular septation protein A